MAKNETSWKVGDALATLQATMDPYIWDQGQDLFRRNAVKDFAISADGHIRVIVLDPRDSRNFFVQLGREHDGRVTAKCECPYRLNGQCRHQVVALEYLSAVASREAAAEPEDSGGPEAAAATAREVGHPLYGLFQLSEPVPTRPDGSLLRLVLIQLGSARSPHRVGLQLWGGTGWTEVRTADLERWIERGPYGPHPRDARLQEALSTDGAIRGEVGSNLLCSLLPLFAGTDALVDRSGGVVEVSLEPFELVGELRRDDGGVVNVEIGCRRDDRIFALAEVELVAGTAAWIQLETGVFHPLFTPACGPELAELQEAPIDLSDSEELERFFADGLPKLNQLCGGRLAMEPGLIEDVEGVRGARVRLAGEPARLAGRLELAYGDEWVAAPDDPSQHLVDVSERIRKYPPPGATLVRAHQELEALGFVREDGEWVLECDDGLVRVLGYRGGRFLRFEVGRDLAALDGVSRTPALAVEVRPGSVGEPEDGAETGGGEASWLHARFSLSCGGEPVDVGAADLARAVHAAARGGRGGGLLQLESGVVLAADHPAVAQLIELARLALTFDGERGVQDGALRLPVAAVGEFLESPEDCDVRLHERLLPFAGALRGEETTERRAVLTPAIEDVLRPYQRAALQWFATLSGWGMGGVLADEMGLGKTLMTLAHFFGRDGALRAESGNPVLVVCPTSLVFNWIEECRRFFPEVEAAALPGRPQSEREKRLALPADLFVTSYALLRRDREALEARDFHAVVLDEAQHIKNPQSQTARAAFALRAAERWGLTGTPVENHLGELWSLFHFVVPGLLGNATDFQRRYRDPIARGDGQVLKGLRRRVGPFILRRTKADVLADLPPCIEQVERVPLTDLERAVYDAQLAAARDALKGPQDGKGRIKVLAALTRLRQICCHLRLVTDGTDTDTDALAGTDANLAGDVTGRTSAKFELLFELLDECFEEGHRVLVFSQFTSMLDLMEERLEEREIRRCRLDGSTRDREGEVRRFASDSRIPLFLISLKAGGLGLNLTQADTVVLYDPWWNPAVEEQAAARAHRIGQQVPVHVHRLVVAGTVEERILELQERKRELASQIVQSGADPAESLSWEELREIVLG